MDIEDNERSARSLQQAVLTEPREPALWANLAVAKMRLRDLPSAKDSMQRALSLAGDSRELTLLRAELLQQSGEIELAIEQLRTLHQ